MKILILSTILNALFLGAFAAEQASPAGSKPPCCAAEQVENGSMSDTSLYLLDSDWTDDSGRVIKLGTLAGRPQIITMFFATCNFACPILVHDMKRIEAALPENVRTNVGFTLITFDSERDTPEVLSAYRKTHELAGNWTLLRAESDDVLELAALLGVKFRKDANGQFAHSNVITVLNAGGEIIFQQPGLNIEPAPAVQAVEKARGTIAPPSQAL